MRYDRMIAAGLWCLAALAGCGHDGQTGGASPVVEPSPVVELTAADFESRIAMGVVLVDFWAPWCGPCRLQGPIVEQLAGQVQGKATVAKLNVDDAPAIAQKFGISSIPTLIVFRDGRAVKQFVGVTQRDELAGAIEAAAKGP
jgi:thioredoxin 1